MIGNSIPSSSISTGHSQLRGFRFISILHI
jgi:hypothetical protein